MRKLLLVAVSTLAVAALVVAGVAVRHTRSAVPTLVFPLSVKGTTFQTGVRGVPGKKLAVGKFNDKIVTGVLQKTIDDFANTLALCGLVPCHDSSTPEAGGTYFLYYDSDTSWRVASNPNGIGTSTLTGGISNDGTFWMQGTYGIPMAIDVANAFVVGKVKFQKGSFEPKSVSGTLYFFSPANRADVGMNLKFKTKGAPTRATL